MQRWRFQGMNMQQRRWKTSYVTRSNLRCIPRALYNPFLDGIVKRESRLRFADRLKNTLLKEPDWMAIADDIQAKRGDHLGKLRLGYFVRNYPLVFEFGHDEHKYKWLRFTTFAKQLFLEHKAYKRKQEHRQYVVEAVTKLLMMSKKRRLDTNRLARLGRYFGFPQNYESAIFCSNLNYFRPVDIKGLRYLEVTQLHPELAVTAREKWISSAKVENPYAFREPEGPISEDVRSYFDEMQKVPFPSPYDHDSPKDLDPTSPSGLKRSLAVYHEILSLTLEKRALLRGLNMLTDELGLPPNPIEFFHSNEPMFYVSMAGERPWVFLREGYDTRLGGSSDKYPLSIFKDRFFAMCMCVPIEKYEKQEIKGGVEFDVEASSEDEFEDDTPPQRLLPIDDLDVDGWCMS